jgi:hypothetical protein
LRRGTAALTAGVASRAGRSMGAVIVELPPPGIVNVANVPPSGRQPFFGSIRMSQ